MKAGQFRHIALLFSLLLFSGAYSQNYSANGRFPGKHFSVEDFNSPAQIWAGMQGTDGLVYFGNNTSILSYNGIEWKQVKIDDHADAKTAAQVKDSKVGAMLVSGNGQMYVGRENNFGYINYNNKGEQRYFPLMSVSKHLKNAFGQVWNIHEMSKGEVLFVGEYGIFGVKDKKVTQKELPKGFEGYKSSTSTLFGDGYLVVFNKEIEGQEERERKYLYIDRSSGKMTTLLLPDYLKIRNIRGSFEINGKWYLLDNWKGDFFSARFQNGKIVWNAKDEIVFPEISGLRPNYVCRKDNFIYVATEDQGVLMVDLKGKIHRRFDIFDELADLNVNRIFHDNESNMWLCLDNGVHIFETSNPITFFKNNEGVSSIAEGIDFSNRDILVGLHSDVFSFERKNTHTSFVSRDLFNQTIFDLKSFNTTKGKKTCVIGYDGIFEYFPDKNTFDTISLTYLVRMCADDKNPDLVYVTMDEGGLASMQLNAKGKWELKVLVTSEQTKGKNLSVVVKNGVVYFGIKGQGVGIYDPRTKKFKILKAKANKEDDGTDFYVELFNNTIYVSGENLIYTVTADNSKIIPFSHNSIYFEKQKDKIIHRLINIDDKQLWVVLYTSAGAGDYRQKFTTGWLEKKEAEWTWTEWPLTGLRNAGIIGTIAKGPDNEIWIGASNGLFVLNFDALSRIKNETSIVIDKFEVNGEILRYNVLKAKSIGDLKYAQNSFKVTFHINSFRGIGAIEYRYKLEGYDDRWSDWTTLNYATFQKISEGNYTLKIQAKNINGIESNIFSYEIHVLPPWYRSTWAYILYFIAFIALIFISIRISTARVKRQNIKLEETVKERTSEIAEQNNQLEHQKAEIEAKSNDILDSIQYAKRIQTTILPSETRLKELFEEHFVFYRPKDIVSGDFYWAREVQGKVIFSAIDCTGHGVPGSLVSIVGNNGLLRAVNEFKLTQPNEILDKLREIVVDAFRTEEQLDVKDGMDIALCTIDYATGELKYAGANNECVIIRGEEIIELKPDKQPIGSFIDAKPFTMKSFNLQDGDSIYLFTDGYVDQFGGEKGKKFKSRQFKVMLLSLHQLTMTQQYDTVQDAFDEWKGELEQVDDVCVFAVRYKSRI